MDSACPRLRRVSFVRNRLCCSRLCRSCFQLMQDCGFDQLRPFLYHTEEKPADNVLLFTLLLCLFLEGWVHLLEMPLVWVVSWKRTVVGGIKSCKMACHADSKSGVVHNLTLTLYLMCIAGSQWKLTAFFFPLSVFSLHFCQYLISFQNGNEGCRFEFGPWDF